MKNYVISTMAVIFGASISFAEPMAGPAASMKNYELVAKVAIKSIDTQKEVQYVNSPTTQAFGYPVELAVIESLSAPQDVQELKFLVPACVIHYGKKFDYPDLTSGKFSVSNTCATACHFSDDKKWMVIEEVLPEEIWGVYLKQKESGEVERRVAPGSEEEVEQDRLNAANMINALGEQVDKGEITEEEYDRQVAPLMEIINRPSSITIL